MKIVRGCVGAAVFVAAAFTLGAMGCLPTAPAMPQIPTATLPTAEIPQAPDVQVPEFTPPDVQAPEGPELPAKPPESRGNCCIRTGNMLKKKCGNAQSCCTDEFEDTGACEAAKGYWFFTPEGCAGAC